MDDIGTNQHSGLRWPGYESRLGQTNVLVQLLDDANEATSKANELKHFADIRRNLSADLLLKSLQVRYAIDPGNYRISTAKDGSARINVGKENLNVSDFLTQHMNIKWAEAKVILAECYQAQQQDQSPLSAKYTRRTTRASSWQDSWRQYVADKKNIFSTKMDRDDRQAALSIALFERLKREELLKDSIIGTISAAKPHAEIQTMSQDPSVDSLAVASDKISIRENMERARREQELSLIHI